METQFPWLLKDNTLDSAIDALTEKFGLSDVVMTFNGFETKTLQKESNNQVCSFIHLNPKPILDFNSLQSEPDTVKARPKLSLILMGNGDFILKDNIIEYVSFLKSICDIDCLILCELEIESEILEKLLLLLQPTLNALSIWRVPLDLHHLEMLNKVQLNLQFLSLGYVESDGINPFQKDLSETQMHRPFDVNKLNFQRLCPQLKFLSLCGVRIIEQTICYLNKIYSSSIEILCLEALKVSQDESESLLSQIFESLYEFRNLKALSLEYNNLSQLDFSMPGRNPNSDIGFRFRFPPTLQTLGLNNCNLNSEQIHDLMQQLTRTNCPLQKVYLYGSYVYPEALETFGIKSENLKFNNAPISETSNSLSSELQDPFTQCKKTSKQIIQPNNVDIFSNLLETSQQMETFLNSKIKPTWARHIEYTTEFVEYLPFFLKLIRQVKFFTDAYRSNIIDFSFKIPLLIPSHDPNLLLSYRTEKQSQAFSSRNSTIVGSYDAPLIRKIDQQLLTDSEWASLPLREQRDKFLFLMKGMNYHCIQIQHDDTIEDQFFFQFGVEKHVAYDYTMATFSLFWYYNQVSIKFNLSNDWFLERDSRVKRYGLPNQDFMLTFCGEWNTHLNTYGFELDVTREGESEIRFRTAILKEGNLNIAKLLFVAIDKGFIMLKVLHKADLFNKGHLVEGAEHSNRLRQNIKEKLLHYEQERDFLNLLIEQNNLLEIPEQEDDWEGVPEIVISTNA